MKEYKVKVHSDRTEWYNMEGQLHREDGPAIEYANGDKYYYINDKLHREDGPAIEWANGDKYYLINDKRHREDGPAIEYVNGYKAYYINDKGLTEQEFNDRNNPTLDKIVEIEGCLKYKLTKV